MNNIYYSPEDFGLTTVGEVERGGGYDFDTFAVWQDNGTGRLYWASDSGCSCPTPFEDVSRKDGLTEVHTIQQLIDALDTWQKEHYEDNHRGEAGSLIVKCREVGTFANQIGGVA